METTGELTRPRQLRLPVADLEPSVADALEDPWAGDDSEWLPDDYDQTRFVSAARGFLLAVVFSVLLWLGIVYAVLALAAV